jgi:hypothetical protein
MWRLLRWVVASLAVCIAILAVGVVLDFYCESLVAESLGLSEILHGPRSGYQVMYVRDPSSKITRYVAWERDQTALDAMYSARDAAYRGGGADQFTFYSCLLHGIPCKPVQVAYNTGRRIGGYSGCPGAPFGPFPLLVLHDVRPIGSIVNILFWTLVIGLISLLWEARRALVRLRKGHCPSCNYDLTGLASGRCPECGMAVQDLLLTTERVEPAPRDATGR